MQQQVSINMNIYSPEVILSSARCEDLLDNRNGNDINDPNSSLRRESDEMTTNPTIGISSGRRTDRPPLGPGGVGVKVEQGHQGERILVQLPKNTDESSEEYLAYNNNINEDGSPAEMMELREQVTSFDDQAHAGNKPHAAPHKECSTSTKQGGYDLSPPPPQHQQAHQHQPPPPAIDHFRRCQQQHQEQQQQHEHELRLAGGASMNLHHSDKNPSHYYSINNNDFLRHLGGHGHDGHDVTNEIIFINDHKPSYAGAPMPVPLHLHHQQGTKGGEHPLPHPQSGVGPVRPPNRPQHANGGLILLQPPQVLQQEQQQGAGDIFLVTGPPSQGNGGNGNRTENSNPNFKSNVGIGAHPRRPTSYTNNHMLGGGGGTGGHHGREYYLLLPQSQNSRQPVDHLPVHLHNPSIVDVAQLLPSERNNQNQNRLEPIQMGMRIRNQRQHQHPQAAVSFQPRHIIIDKNVGAEGNVAAYINEEAHPFLQDRARYVDILKMNGVQSTSAFARGHPPVDTRNFLPKSNVSQFVTTGANSNKPLQGNSSDKKEQPKKQKQKQKSQRNRRSDLNTRPRRPLNAYNFFFSEERERVLVLLPSTINKKSTTSGQGKELHSQGVATIAAEGAVDGATIEGTNENADKNKADIRITSSQCNHLNDADYKELEAKISANTQRILATHTRIKKPTKAQRKIHGKIKFQSLAKTIAGRWLALSDDKKQYYKDLAKKDKLRYVEGMKTYNKIENRINYSD